MSQENQPDFDQVVLDRCYVPEFCKRAAERGRPVDMEFLPEALEIADRVTSRQRDLQTGGVKAAAADLRSALGVADETKTAADGQAALADAQDDVLGPALLQMAVARYGGQNQEPPAA